MSLFFAIVASATLGTVPEVISSFEEYTTIFNKSYYSPSVEAKARNAFKANMEFVLAHNEEADRGVHTFRVGANEFSDMTYESWRVKYLGTRISNSSAKYTVLPERTAADPVSVDWRAKGAVTPVKNQGTCGSCWAFSTIGALEGAYQVATGALRSLSEQQLMDCSSDLGNGACQGGQLTIAMEYMVMNGGVDSEDEYGYEGAEDVCWTAAEKRHAATINNFAQVASTEVQLEAAVALGPVAVAIEADQPAFQQYKSGVFSAPCGTKLDHGVLVVGYTADTWIVKNSWGSSWGEQGFIEMKRGVGPQGICGIATMPVFAIVNKAPAPPLPPKTPTPKPPLPCDCTRSCSAMCGHMGWACCGGAGGSCSCSPASSCPQCNISPKELPYAACGPGCGSCLSTEGVPGNYCGSGAGACSSSVKCPPTTLPNVTAVPHCTLCMTGSKPYVPSQCALICTSTTTKTPFNQDGCPIGATCKPLSLDKDPCENKPAGLPCGDKCGICTYGN